MNKKRINVTKKRKKLSIKRKTKHINKEKIGLQ